MNNKNTTRIRLFFFLSQKCINILGQKFFLASVFWLKNIKWQLPCRKLWCYLLGRLNSKICIKVRFMKTSQFYHVIVISVEMKKAHLDIDANGQIK